MNFNFKLKPHSIDVNIKVDHISPPIPIRELVGALPLDFKSVGEDLIDWSITGAAGGVGKLGKNYLKQKTTSIPNGAAGTYLAGGVDWEDILNGITFTTTATTTRLGLQFHVTTNTNIVPSGVGDIMLVEGSTIPSSYDAATNLFNKTITQGAYTSHNDYLLADTTQSLYGGDDGYGGYQLYRPRIQTEEERRAFLQTRCKIFTTQEVKPNTTYSVRVFNSSYNNLEGAKYLFKEPGTITPHFMPLSSQKSIPGNETFVTNTEQWVDLTPSYTRETGSSNVRTVAVDARPMVYEYCESFADLKAGTYKLMIDIWANTLMSDNLTIGCSDYTGCCDDNWLGDLYGVEEFFALVKEDNTFAIPKTNIFASGTTKKSKYEPYPNYHHREFTFTLDSDTKVGLFHKAYYTSSTYAYPPYFRFYIVDSDVVADDFVTTGIWPSNISGDSAWEKYTVTLPVTVTSGNQSQTVTLDLGDSLLEANDTISFSDTHVSIPTYSGANTITVDSEVQPSEMYIKYRKY